MPITQSDDGWIRTHEDARQCLKYASIGATVVFNRLGHKGGATETEAGLAASREYTLVLDGAPKFALNAFDAYSLPCRADKLIARARLLCESGKRALDLGKGSATL